MNEEAFNEPIITSLMTEIAMRPSTGYQGYDTFSDISTADLTIRPDVDEKDL